MTFDVKIVTENLEDLYFHSSFEDTQDLEV